MGLIASSCNLGLEMVHAPCFRGDRSHDWIFTQVSRALREELNDIIGHFTNRLVSRFEGQILAIWTVDGLSGVTLK